jgi:hypothetical protein
VALYQPQRLLRIPAVHQNHAHAEDQRDRHGERQRRRVVERARAQIQVLAGLMHDALAHLAQGAQTAAFAVYSLGPAGGSRGVEHLGSHRGIDQVVGSLRFASRVVRLEVLDGAAHGQPGFEARRTPDRIAYRLCEACVGHQGARLAVFENVGDLLAGQVPVDRRQTQAAALHPIVDFDELRAVRADHGHPVPGPQARRAQRASQLIGAPVQRIKAAVAVGRHDCRLLRGLACVHRQGHPHCLGFAARESSTVHGRPILPRGILRDPCPFASPS